MRSPGQLRALRLRPSTLRKPLTQRPLHPSTRQASTTAADARSVATRTKNLLYGAVLTLGLSFGFLYITDTRSSFHQWLVVPALRQIYPDGEDAHKAGTAILQALYRFGLHPRERGDPDAANDLTVDIFGHTLSNPIGTSAGIDKGAEVPTQLLALGASIVEVGAVTPRPQEGNPKPRVFRIPSQNALINRYGFNSEGAEVVATRLRQRVREFAYRLGLGVDEEAERIVLDGEAGVPPGSLTPGRLMAVQIAKNKDTSEQDIEAVKRDYSTCVKHLAKYADILVVNVSSPNTPGLRELQNVEPLTHLLTSVVEAVKQVDRKTRPAIMVKVSPDEDSDTQVAGVCEAVWDSGVDGVIVGNTTKKRPDPLPKGYQLPQNESTILLEQGGYSGPQMFERTRALVSKYRKTLDAGPKQPSSPSPKEYTTPISGHSTGDELDSSITDKLELPTTRDHQESSSSPPSPTADLTSASDNQPSHSFPSLNAPQPLSSTVSAPASPRKVVFATGGITNGRQAKEILDAGASVAMVYTALIYGGVGTISRIKREIREDEKERK